MIWPGEAAGRRFPRSRRRPQRRSATACAPRNEFASWRVARFLVDPATVPGTQRHPTFYFFTRRTRNSGGLIHTLPGRLDPELLLFSTDVDP
jgi:hypothetical protein